MSMPFNKILISLMVFFCLSGIVSGCVFHVVNAHEMVNQMESIKSDSGSVINILWYQGGDGSFSYFSYVYTMSGTRHFKVPAGQFIIDNDINFSEDSNNWIRVNSIDDVWFASRLKDGAWVRDGEGVKIRVIKK